MKTGVIIVLIVAVGVAVWIGMKNSESESDVLNAEQNTEAEEATEETTEGTEENEQLEESSEETMDEQTNETNETVETEDGLVIEDLQVGEGVEAKEGDTVRVHYTGTLQSGETFDTSRQPGRGPFEFTIGAGRVIEGWEKGVVGMRVGGVRKLVIPPELAYGSREIPGIPANSTLVFEIELLEVVE